MDQGIAIVIAAAFPSIAVILEHRSTRKKIGGVDKKVDTLNESTIGELASANETRRVEHKPHDERTVQEQHHVDTAPEVDPPQGPGR